MAQVSNSTDTAVSYARVSSSSIRQQPKTAPQSGQPQQTAQTTPDQQRLNERTNSTNAQKTSFNRERPNVDPQVSQIAGNGTTYDLKAPKGTYVNLLV